MYPSMDVLIVEIYFWLYHGLGDEYGWLDMLPRERWKVRYFLGYNCVECCGGRGEGDDKKVNRRKGLRREHLTW